MIHKCSDKSSSVLLAVSYLRKSLRLENTKGSLQSEICGSNNEPRGRLRDGSGSNIVVQCSIVHIIKLHGRITTREYVGSLGNQVDSMFQMLFPSNDAVFQQDNAPIHRAGTIHSWFEEHEGKLQHLY
jgi:hypothetical protein